MANLERKSTRGIKTTPETENGLDANTERNMEMFGFMTQEKKFQSALLALEAGIDRTYEAYVKPIKLGRTDKGLTEDEKARARSMARARAFKLCREKKLDFLKIIGESYVDVWIARIIQRRRLGS